MNKMKILCALLLIVTLSACSSGGGGGSSKAKSNDPDTPSADSTPSDGGGGGDSTPSGGGGGSVVPVVPIDLSEAPGLEGNAVDASTLLRIEAAFVEVDRRIALPSTDDDALVALTTTNPPTGRAILNGYIRIPGKVTGEIIVGNLEIGFDSRDPNNLIIDATDLVEFDVSGSGGPAPITGSTIDPTNIGNVLNGDASIATDNTGTAITGRISGNLFSTDAGYQVKVAANLNGDFYNDDDGMIITYGTVSGTTTHSGTVNTFTDADGGEFAAREEE